MSPMHEGWKTFCLHCLALAREAISQEALVTEDSPTRRSELSILHSSAAYAQPSP